MNIPQGPWFIDDLLTFTVTTHRVDTGALTDADSVPTYRVYEDETGTAILTGSMAKLDDANTTGFYSEQLTLSAANGFEVGKTYSIYVAATVNSVAGGQSGGFKVVGALATAADLATVDTVVDAIKAKTDNLPSDPADASDIATATGAILSDTNAILVDTGTTIPAQIAALSIPTAAQNATELLDQTAGVETGLTVRQWLRLAASVLFGKASGLATTTAVYRDVGDTKDRITATVDADGNRTAITRDAT